MQVQLVRDLGHLITGGTIAADPVKAETIAMLPEPTCIKEYNSL